MQQAELDKQSAYIWHESSGSKTYPTATIAFKRSASMIVDEWEEASRL